MKKIIYLIFIFHIFIVGCKQSTSNNTPDRPSTVTPTNTNNTGCLASDTDKDGIPDCQDPDIDNDGHLNQVPPVKLNFLCYQQTSEYNCANASSSAGTCVWDSNQNTCSSKSSCGDLYKTKDSCQNATGCTWDTTRNLCDQDDWFPYDATDYKDSDKDGVGDIKDAFPNDPTEWSDFRGIGLGDNANPDDDNDGMPDVWDDFYHDSTEWFDVSKSKLGDNSNPDWDLDGIPNVWDDMPYNAGTFDISHNMIDDSVDPDIDGDGIPNKYDAFPYDPTEWRDFAHSGLGDNVNPDDDNDGMPDVWDDFPLDSASQYDTDGDGVPNQLDAFPYDPSEWKDSDGDGVGDNKDAFPLDPTEWRDTNGNGIGDNKDPDADSDGYANTIPPIDEADMNLSCYKQLNATTCSNASVSPKLMCSWINNNHCVPTNSCGVYATQNTCANVQGCFWDGNACNNSDLFPFDKTEHSDFMHSGIGDNSNPDWDLDGMPNVWDDFAKDPKAWVDMDNDGLIDYQNPTTTTEYANMQTPYYGVKIDPDIDNDGMPDVWDDLPTDAGEQFDTDHDGIGNNADPDIDGDGVPNALDKFPFDSTEWSDLLNTGIGDNANPDDDNDGMPDVWDDLPSNSFGFFDLNKDGNPDQTSTDIDGDGIGNGLAPTVYIDPIHPEKGVFSPYGVLCGIDSNHDGIPDSNIGSSINNFICGYPNSLDAFPFDSTETTDTNKNGIGDNSEPDADNDGMPTLWDDLPLDATGFFDFDKDGIPDNLDTDIDGDGKTNGLEADVVASPYGMFCGIASVANGTLDTVSVNNFTCDFRNTNDDFPYDSSDYLDTDGDGLGDSIDPDIDNDGVPNVWDDFPTDLNYYWDNDHDGVPNELDLYTPNGINSEADVNTAIAHGENIVLTSNITLTSCVQLPEGKSFISSTDMFQVTYAGSNANCVINVLRATPVAGTSLTTSIGNFILNIPADKTDIVAVTSNGALDELDMSNIFFKYQGTGRIADIFIRNQFRFLRNDIVFDSKNVISSLNSKLINVKSSSPTSSDYLTTIFGGNIVFWNLSVNQTNPLYLFYGANPIRKFTVQSNVINFSKSAGVTHNGFTAFNIDFDYNTAATDASLFGKITNSTNRVNMTTGTYVNLTSSNLTLKQNNVESFENKIYGFSSFGHPYFNSDIRTYLSSGCDAQNSQSACNGNQLCTWTNGSASTGNYCVNNYSTAPASSSTYYDFKTTDTFLNPARQDYSMFYYPNTTKMSTSPALFDSGTNDKEDINIVQELDLGLGKVYYVGAFSPVKDSDGDGVPDDEDLFPFDPNEWRDSDGDGIGNNADPDNDNDGLNDVLEYSVCKSNGDEASCNDAKVCTWDNTKKACMRNMNVCASFTTSSTCSSLPICAWDSSSSTCSLGSAQKGCLVANSTWNQSSMCCLNGSSQCVDGTDPYNRDTDGDGLSDYDEIYKYHTNPLLWDTDGDGVSDGDEIADGTNPLDINSSKDTDGDGLNDRYEKLNLIPLGCTNPQNSVDTDGDGLTDYEEVMIYHTNPCKVDTDHDGLTDYEEVKIYHTDPLVADTDGDGINDYDEVKVYHTNPLVADTDGDGVSDYQEIQDGTNPNDVQSFKDTNHDGIPDVLDKTPFGVTPYPTCTNTSLANCSNTFTNAQYEEEFYQQFNEANSCYSKNSSSLCNSTTRGLCSWNSSTSKCESRAIILNSDITFDNAATHNVCFTVNANSSITIKGNVSRRKITIKNAMFNASTCNSESSLSPSGAASPLNFITLANSGSSTGSITLDNIKVEQESSMPYFIGMNSSSKNSNITINNSEFYGTNKSGPIFITAYNPLFLNITKSTFKSVLNATNSPINPNSSLLIKNTDVSIPTTLNLKGNIFYCDTQNQIMNMVLASQSFSCIQTEGDSLNFEGNLVLLEQSNAVGNSIVDDINNLIFAWKHTEGILPLTIRNTRVYSSMKTISITNPSATVDITNLSVKSGSSTNPGTIYWGGINSSTPGVLPNGFNYNFLFHDANPNTTLVSCIYGAADSDADIQAGVIHPAYFLNSPTQVYWNSVFRFDKNIQLPGATNNICP